MKHTAACGCIIEKLNTTPPLGGGIIDVEGFQREIKDIAVVKCAKCLKYEKQRINLIPEAEAMTNEKVGTELSKCRGTEQKNKWTTVFLATIQTLWEERHGV